MAVKVTFGPTSGKYSFHTGHVEVDGIDISNRVTSVSFKGDSQEGCRLELSLVLGDEDTVDLDLAGEDVTAVVRSLKVEGGLIDVTAVGDIAKKYRLAARA
jgi:hypothetical protein